MSDARMRFAYSIWERAEPKLVRAERALGASWTEAYEVAWRHCDEIVDLALAPDRPLKTLGIRQITGKEKL